MDLSNLDVSKKAEDGAILELEHPVTGDPLINEDSGEAVSIIVLGTDSKTYREKQREYQRKRLSKMTKKRGKEMDLTMSDEDACDLLATCTIGWEHMVENGEELEFSKEAAYKLYMKYHWIREQVDVFIADRENFI